jgi:peptidyl-prolyl cis-trans isomerase A (cyclophilin A)
MVTQGMEVVDGFYSAYGDGPPYGRNGPEQGRLQGEGNEYLKSFFPKLDYIKSVAVAP